MSRVKNKNTDAELLLRKKLWDKGLRYRVNYNIVGKPDVAVPSIKLAIFCDGDFWHGKTFEEDENSYSDFWKYKISTNMTRDKKVNAHLKKKGWTVLRFWGSRILKSPDEIASKVIDKAEELRQNDL